MQRSNPEVAKKYNCKRWKKLRQMKLGINPFCERCQARGVYVPAYIIHHKEYITQENYMDDDVFFNLDNLESICLECHNKEHFGEEVDYYFDEDGDLIKK